MTIELLTGFVALTGLEVILGIDNILVLAILCERVPERQRGAARTLGLTLALGGRIVLLGAINKLTRLTAPLLTVGVHSFSWRDLILLGGGVFLLWKSVHEMHRAVEVMEDHESHDVRGTCGRSSFGSIVMQIILLDVVFSIDSIITAVGVSNHLGVMIAAVVTAVLAMMLFVGTVAKFLNSRPTLKILALAFLMLVGMTLILEGFHLVVPKGYMYSAMGFSLGVELLHLRYHRRLKERSPARVL